MMRRRRLLAAALGLPLSAWALGAPKDPLPADDGVIAALLRADPGPVPQVWSALEEFEPQILWTRIERRPGRRPRLLHRSFGLDPKRWFAAASLVKLPIAIVTLERTNEIGLGTRWHDLRMEVRGAPQCIASELEREAEVSLEESLRRLLVISENPPYNRLYEWLGQAWLHRRLHELGYPHARLVSRLMSCSPDENRYTGEVRILDRRGRVLHRQAARRHARILRFPHGPVRVGSAWSADGILRPGPSDLSRANFLPLWDVHRMLITLVLPETVAPRQRFRLTAEQRAFLLDTMTMVPRMSPRPRFDEADYPDNYCKFLIVGDRPGRMPEDLSITNRIGEAFGYLSDVAYVHDRASGAEFFLSATVHVNADRVLNDGRYEYDTIGHPALGHLGRVILAAERAARGA